MKRTKRAAAVLALLALLAAGCGDSDTTATRDPKPADSTVAGGEPTQQTADSTPATRAESPWPWHAPGSAHGEPADAVAEFVEYFEFDPMVVLTDYQESDAHSGEIEIVPPLLGEPFVPAESPGMSPTEWANERLGEMYEGGWAGPTTAFVRLDDDHAWVVTGAVSGVVAVESPAPDAAVSSPLDILYTNNIMTNGVVIELWPVGADEPIATKTNPERGDAFSAGERLVTMEWSSNAVGPVTVIMTSARPVVGVVTFELELEPRSDPPPFTDPVGDQRREHPVPARRAPVGVRARRVR